MSVLNVRNLLDENLILLNIGEYIQEKGLMSVVNVANPLLEEITSLYI